MDATAQPRGLELWVGRTVIAVVVGWLAYTAAFGPPSLLPRRGADRVIHELGWSSAARCEDLIKTNLDKGRFPTPSVTAVDISCGHGGGDGVVYFRFASKATAARAALEGLGPVDYRPVRLRYCRFGAEIVTDYLYSLHRFMRLCSDLSGTLGVTSPR